MLFMYVNLIFYKIKYRFLNNFLTDQEQKATPHSHRSKVRSLRSDRDAKNLYIASLHVPPFSHLSLTYRAQAEPAF